MSNIKQQIEHKKKEFNKYFWTIMFLFLIGLTISTIGVLLKSIPIMLSILVILAIMLACVSKMRNIKAQINMLMEEDNYG